MNVRITIGETHAYFAEKLLPLVQQELEFPISTFTLGDGRVKREMLLERHFAVSNGSVAIAHGLVHRVVQQLSNQGFKTEVTGEIDLRGRSDESQLRSQHISRADRRFLTSLSGKRYGQVRLPRNDIAWHIGLLASYFCGCNVLVVARDNQSVDHLHQSIQESTEWNVTRRLQSPTTYGDPPYLHIGNRALYAIFAKENWDVTVFADVESVLAEKSLSSATTWPTSTHARFAFVPPDYTLSSDEQFRIELICGPVIYSQPSLTETKQRVNVVLCRSPIHGGNNLANGLERKRQLYWLNQTRNECIAKTARLLQDNNFNELVSNGVVPAELDRPLTTSILVESTQHAKQLQPLLPGWQIASQNEMRSCIPQIYDREIATLSCAATWGIATNVLIRADGGEGWPLAGVYPSCSAKNGSVIIDFADNADKHARRETLSRKSAYEALGWQVTDDQE